jgi:hypothetical protein
MHADDDVTGAGLVDGEAALGVAHVEMLVALVSSSFKRP